jgi:DNA polymerase III epsilon subunit family exonuclease
VQVFPVRITYKMPPFPNLISESVLVSDTISYLQAVGGEATAVRVVDRVMKIRRPDPGFANILVSDLTERDTRLTLADGIVTYRDAKHDQIELSMAEYVALDVETTGSKPPGSRVMEIAAYRVKDGKVAESFQSLVNPEMPIPDFIIGLTGISDAMVAKAPRFAEIANELIEFIGDSVVVAHNAQFDMAFLNYEIGRVYEDYRLGNASLCTVQLSRSLVEDVENHKLKTMANYYAVDLINHHRASDDAHATAKILVYLLRELETRGVNNIGAARRLSRKKPYVRESKAAA